MSGHSKWHSIKHKKAAEDSKRGKIFTKHAKLIAIAARGGGDPSTNPSLRMAIENAKAENLPVDNIDRAIKKGTGEGKDAAQMEEIFYEGFGPGGTALYIETLTDNKNRTFSNLKLVISKHGGHLGAAGSVGYLFKKRGIVMVPVIGKSVEELELAAIDAGAEDVKIVVHGDPDAPETAVEVYTDPQALMRVKTELEKMGIKVESASLTYLPQTIVTIDDAETAKKILDLISKVEEDDDINTVYSNFEISE